jgi:hypothetical protein
MAMTDAEKKRAQRERQEAAKRKSADSSYPYLKQPFSEYPGLDGNYSNVEIALGLIGVVAPEIEDERDPDAFALDEVVAGVENPFPGAKGAIGRAEVMIECYLDAAMELASIVNTYKRSEVNARLQELEQMENAGAEAIAEGVKLNKILDALEKNVRRQIPNWKVVID